jgi:hypothetical protein
MRKLSWRIGWLAAGALGAVAAAGAKTPEGAPVAVLVAGPPSHGPGAHEYNAGVLLFAKCLAQGAPRLIVRTHLNGDWPNGQELAEADTILFYCDGGDRHLMLRDGHLGALAPAMQRGAGLVLLHYATEFPTARGGPEALRWAGGFFAINWSVNPIWSARFSELPALPVTRGVRPFQSTDEWYYHMRFNERIGRLVPILTDRPPASSLDRPDGEHSGNPAVRAAVAAGQAQTMAWAYERPGGGRSFSFTGGHYHKNWAQADQRKLVLNAILWTAGMEVPAEGVASQLTAADLSAHLDPKPPSPPPPAPPQP